MSIMQRAAAIAVVILWLTVVTSSSGGSPQDPVSGMRILQNWIEAVNSHTPGRSDASVVTVSALSYQERKDLNAGMNFFLTALTSKKVIYASSEIGKHIANLARAARENPGADAFLKRAVVLHSDAGAYRRYFPVPSGGPADVPSPVPPLLTSNRIVLDKDGQILGEVVANWNWPFARSLLDVIPRGTDDPFLGAWYHATATFMFANGWYGEATPHLQRAAAVLPEDARILFDRACYAEILGLPMHQVLLPDADVPRDRGGAFDWTGRRHTSQTEELGIPRAEVTNAEAERLFRHALRVDPSFVEARVRLARLLDLRKHHEEAAAELTIALAAHPTGEVAFYAHLFAGRAAQALGRIDEASRHYQDAAALFPDAQSALLASSQLALLGSDVPAALTPVQHLGARPSAFTADPWWQYHLGAGRDAEDMLSEVWAMVPR